jgi:flagellar hook assembly protein FlgD
MPPLCNPPESTAPISRYPASFDPYHNQVTTISVDFSSYLGQTGKVWMENAKGDSLVTLFEATLSGSPVQVSWDGKDSGGLTRRQGIYLIKAAIWDEGLSQWTQVGQCDTVIYRPKWGVTQYKPYKYTIPATDDTPVSGDDWVIAGMANPGDTIAVAFDDNPVSLAYLDPNGLFRSSPVSYSPGTHSVAVSITPYGTQDPYLTTQSVYLNRIVVTAACAWINGACVRSDRYFYPSQGETFKVWFILDASEPDARLGVSKKYTHISQIPTDHPHETLIGLGALGNGSHTAQWDGRDDQGNIVAPDNYVVEVLTFPDPSQATYSPTMLFTRINVEVR